MRVEVDERHTARGRYRRSRALSKPRRAGYFAPDARASEPVRTGPDDGSLSSGDRRRRARGAGHTRARLPAARRVREQRSRPSRPAAAHHRLSPGRVRRGPGVARPGAARRSGRVALHRRRPARRAPPSSPAVAMGVLGELEARGPFGQTLLAVTVLKDVAAAILFTLLLAAGTAFASAGALRATVAGSALLTLVASLAVGALLGYGLSGYLRLIQRHVASFVGAVAVVAAEVARLVHLETIVVALAAGLYLATFAPVEGERVRHELKRGWQPVYILFFVLAGAGLRLGALAELWPWVLLLVGR